MAQGIPNSKCGLCASLGRRASKSSLPFSLAARSLEAPRQIVLCVIVMAACGVYSTDWHIKVG